MRISCSLLSLFAFVSLALAAPSPDSFVVKDKVHLPRDWVRRSVAPAHHHVNLHIGLAKRNQAGLEARLLEVSDPKNKDYGHWLTHEEVDSFIEPTNETRDIVARWLKEHDLTDAHITKRTVSGNSISVDVPIYKARAMLGGPDFNIYEHRDTGEQRLTTESYSLPRDVAPHIDTIFSLANFARSAAFRTPLIVADDKFKDASVKVSVSKKGGPASCNFDYVTAHCLRDLYGFNDYKVYGKGQHIGISGYLEEYAIFSDLQLYLKDQRYTKVGYNFTVSSISGGLNDQTKPGSEANLDVQTVAGLAAPIRSTYYTTAGRPPFQPDNFTPTNTNEPYADQIEFLLGRVHPPSVLSTSYGDDEQTVPIEYAKRVCGDMAALTALGTSIIFASGDHGVGPSGNCFSNDGLKTPKFLPIFPASCPWVTSVGATENFAPENAVTSFATGAGFSDYFPRPPWQNDAVTGFLKTVNSSYNGLYNTSGRGFPDIAAQGSRYKIWVGGRYAALSGTSASAPTVAAIIGLLNDARLKAGRRTLGFLNPWIYSLEGKGFNDIVSGNSRGCGTDGFITTKGWDAATGFGTPKFKTLLASALKL